MTIPAFFFYKRFIPTGVGNILWLNSSKSMTSVHPHGCGEHPPSTMALIRRSGSSPRVWGTFNSLYCRIQEMRFIPTGVGNI